jgi:hypothetical protein
MPVNMDPAKKRRRTPPSDQPTHTSPAEEKTRAADFGQETEEDRIKALADAEKKNLWDATEVIDMDKF